MVDPGLTISATDLDLIVKNPSAQDTSCNEITWAVIDETHLDPIIKCEVELLESSGEYDVLLSLTQRLDNSDLGLGDTYTFKIVTKVIFVN